MNPQVVTKVWRLYCIVFYLDVARTVESAGRRRSGENIAFRFPMKMGVDPENDLCKTGAAGAERTQRTGSLRSTAP